MSARTPTPTPGPWKARELITKDNRSLGWIIEHANGRIGWSDYATTNVGEDPPFPISEANARLIASAPDLLTALKEIAEQCRNGGPRDTYNTAMAAIAKAKES